MTAIQWSTGLSSWNMNINCSKQKAFQGIRISSHQTQVICSNLFPAVSIHLIFSRRKAVIWSYHCAISTKAKMRSPVATSTSQWFCCCLKGRDFGSKTIVILWQLKTEWTENWHSCVYEVWAWPPHCWPRGRWHSYFEAWIWCTSCGHAWHHLGERWQCCSNWSTLPDTAVMRRRRDLFFFFF